MANLTVATVNVNGLRAAVYRGKAAKKGFGMGEWFKSQKKKGLDILCLQETRVSKDGNEKDLDRIFAELGIDSQHFYLHESANKSGHAGVGVWINPETCQKISVKYPLENMGFSGRWQEIIVKFANQEIALANSYYHSAKSPIFNKKRGLVEGSEKSINDKHCFFDKTTQRMRKLTSEYKNFILVGDINTAHRDIDIKNHKGNKKKAGFLPEERAWLDLWFAEQGNMNVQSTYAEGQTAMDVYKGKFTSEYTPPTKEFAKGGLGLRDIVRDKYGKKAEIYSWWTWRGRAFNKNAGWRIDYQIASENMAKSVAKAKIHGHGSVEYEERWSDHAPVVVTYSM